VTFGELFAGIGGFSLGLERAGMTCAWQVEIDPYARAVLNKHWPDVPKHDDVRTFPPQGDYGVDLICGGFPCQDISVAGKGAGLAGERSGLWNDFARIIRTVRPRWVVIENVPALTARGLGTVLGDLAEIGFDAEWHCIPASAVGAPHRRERLWIVAYPTSVGVEGNRSVGQQVSRAQACSWLSRCNRTRQRGQHWTAQPSVGVLANGFPNRLSRWGDAMRCLGNAVVPQVVEIIGRAILEAEARMTA
jgi:DNA (cytosine-5)-methyltransferase 1